jgi:hypothetical protein
MAAAARWSARAVMSVTSSASNFCALLLDMKKIY